MVFCKIDNKELISIKALTQYLKRYDISVLEYYQQYENFVIPKCTICNKLCSHRGGISFNKTCGDNNCYKKLRSQIIITDETREKMRIKRVDYLKKRTGKTAWERRSLGQMSFLESSFFDKATAIDIFKKYDVVSEYCVFPYFIDFAFINEKVAVELDGKCHFINGNKRVEHDIKRDLYLTEQGWRIFRIRYDDDINLKIAEFLDFIGTSKMKNYDDRLYFYTEIKKSKAKYGKRYDYNKAVTEIYNQIEKIKIEKIINSNIDFSKTGWVQSVAKLIEKPYQKVNGWMKRFMPEFYENKCFKRKNMNKHEHI